MSEGLRARVGDLRQIASVRRITLDDGPERGVRALAFSTGGGLDFWVLADRTMDIGPLWWRGAQLGWQSPTGFTSPGLIDAESDGGRGFNRGFSGFLVTCGLTHIRQPTESEPLHGRLPFTPARLTAYGEDWDAAVPVLFAEGVVVQARYGGEAVSMRRRIEAPIGGNVLRISDVVENISAGATPLALLYHFNLGWPAIGPETTVSLPGGEMLGPLPFPEATVPDPLIRPSGDGGADAECRVTTPSGPSGHLGLRFRFASGQLPWLQVWRDLRRRSGVLSIEPCSHSGTPEFLGPGEGCRFDLEVHAEGAAGGVVSSE